MDRINNKVSVEYLYDEKKNLYRAMKRVTVLHKKIISKPEIASEMDQYIREKVENKNYIEINLHEAHLNKFQLYLVSYNFVVSSKSSSTKVRMTTDSFMSTESYLSLNDVTKPAPVYMLQPLRYSDAFQASCVLFCV